MLDQILSEHYALTNVTLTPAPRGFVAETYYVDSDTGRYFAKIIKISPDSDILEASLPVLRELQQLGIDHIIYPIPTATGALSITFDGKILALFNCVAGQWVFDFPFEPYVKLLGQLHNAILQTPLAREDYELPWRAQVLGQLEHLWTGTFTHPQEQAMQTWALDQRAAIERDWLLLNQAADQLKTQNLPDVLTHGDAAGNILLDGDEIYMVDWDMVLFAPRERDTWFHFQDAKFLPLYRQVKPDYEFDRTAYRFYLYKRYFEDIIGYVDNVFSPESSDEEKLQNLNDHYQTCDEWLRPLMDADRTNA